jgi:hypothetical protein
MVSTAIGGFYGDGLNIEYPAGFIHGLELEGIYVYNEFGFVFVRHTDLYLLWPDNSRYVRVVFRRSSGGDVDAQDLYSASMFTYTLSTVIAPQGTIRRQLNDLEVKVISNQ